MEQQDSPVWSSNDFEKPLAGYEYIDFEEPFAIYLGSIMKILQTLLKNVFCSFIL